MLPGFVAVDLDMVIRARLEEPIDTPSDAIPAVEGMIELVTDSCLNCGQPLPCPGRFCSADCQWFWEVSHPSEAPVP